MRREIRTAVIVFLALAGSSAWSGADPVADEARAADAAMARACAARDRAAFAAFLDERSVFVTRGGPARGPAEIAAAWASLFDAGGPTLHWEPEEASGSRDGEMAVTLGRFRLEREGAEPATGRYVTAWQRSADGRLRVAYDASQGPAIPAGARRAREDERVADGLAVEYGTYVDAEFEGGAARGSYLIVRFPGESSIQTAIEHGRFTLDGARALLDDGKADEARAEVEELTTLRPELAAGWRLLAAIHQRAECWHDAIHAGRRAAALGDAAAMYDLACAHAREGRTAEAVAWLEMAAATRRCDVTRAFFDPDLVAIEDDPRVRALLPPPADVAQPFDLPVKVLHEWRGDSEGGSFGWIARRLGDVDGDGAADLVTSAPDAAGEAGRVHVFSGRSGRELWRREGTGKEGLGTGLEAAGDVDGDGIPDVIAGAPGASRAYVLGGRDGRLLRTIQGEAPEEMLGRSVKGVGDVDGDGRSDLLVGAPGRGRGLAALFSGRDGRELLRLEGEAEGDRFGSVVGGGPSAGGVVLLVGAPDAGPGKRGRLYVHDARGPAAPRFVVDAAETGRELGGMFCSLPGDVDGDGTVDVYVSDWQDAARGPVTGRIHVVSGLDGRRILDVAGEAEGDGFGIGPADAGDLDGDGRADLVVGAWRESSAAPAGGKVSVISGATGRVIAEVSGRVMGETLGFDAQGMGDVDGDGTVDLLVTSAWSPVAGPRSGRVFLVSLPAHTR